MLSNITLKGMMRQKLPAIVLCVCALALLSAACTSTPVARHPPEDKRIQEVYHLPVGGSVYLWADIAQARPLLENLSSSLNLFDASQAFDYAKAAAFVVFLEGEDGEPNFFLAATGNFPLRRANLALSTSRSWERRTGESGERYWYSPSSGFSLALSPRLVLASNTGLYEVSRTITPPESFGAFSEPLAISAWIPHSTKLINGFVESIALPIQIPATELFLGAARVGQTASTAGRRSEPVDEAWEFVIRIVTPSANDARSLATLVSMARLFLQQDGNADTDNFLALLFANAPEQSGNALTLRTPPIKRSRIPLLFNQF